MNHSRVSLSFPDCIASATGFVLVFPGSEAVFSSTRSALVKAAQIAFFDEVIYSVWYQPFRHKVHVWKVKVHVWKVKVHV